MANYGLRGTGAGSQRLDFEGLRPPSARGGDIRAREGVLGHTKIELTSVSAAGTWLGGRSSTSVSHNATSSALNAACSSANAYRRYIARSRALVRRRRWDQGRDGSPRRPRRHRDLLSRLSVSSPWKCDPCKRPIPTSAWPMTASCSRSNSSLSAPEHAVTCSDPVVMEVIALTLSHPRRSKITRTIRCS